MKMKNQTIRYTLLSCLFLFSGYFLSNAQERSLPQWTISFEPQYLLNASFRLNLEKRLNKKDWLELNLTGYKLPHSDDEDEDIAFLPFHTYDWDGYGTMFQTLGSDGDPFLGMSGLGIGLSYKHYFTSIWYIGGSVSYNYFDIEYEDTGFHKYATEHDLTYYSYEQTDLRQYINKVGGNIRVGIHPTFEHVFSVEPYVGIGYERSFSDKDKKAFDKTMFGYGYTGVFLLVGVKLGINIW
jgi:hypothetical protein